MVAGVDSPSSSPLNPPVNPVDSVSNVAPVNQARQTAILNSSQIVAGKQFQAEVIASLKDGTFIVRIADTAARMQLPNSPKAGDKLQLTLISTSPRATFLINPSGEEGDTIQATATLGTVTQLMEEFDAGKPAASAGLYLRTGANAGSVAEIDAAEVPPRLTTLTTPSTNGTPATFSQAGKLVNELIQTMSAKSNVVQGQAPLIDVAETAINNSTVLADTITKALHSSVSSSGLFYESHLLDWAEGRLTTSELMKEPQARLTTPAPSSLVESTLKTTEDANPALANSAITLAHGAAPLIQQQLHALEQQRFMWHGELWSGQPLEWDVSRDNQNHESGQSGETADQWQSAVRFELPQLGAVSAQLQLAGDRLNLTINTLDDTATKRLQHHANELVEALKGSGTQLESFVITTKTDKA